MLAFTGPVHLPEWTLTENVLPLTEILTSTLTLHLTLKHKNLFGENEMTSFFGQVSRYGSTDITIVFRRVNDIKVLRPYSKSQT